MSGSTVAEFGVRLPNPYCFERCPGRVPFRCTLRTRHIDCPQHEAWDSTGRLVAAWNAVEVKS